MDKLDLGLTDVIQHTVDLQDKTTPAYKGQFRLAMDQLQLIKDNVAGWLKAGLIENSGSKFNAPVFCVPKREGHGLRVVLDYRMLNHRSVPDKYSIRTIDQCLEEIGRAGSQVFSCLDLTNGFWQLKMRESDKHLTAFTIPGLGQFQWMVTPQGLMGAPASFSRLMDRIMADTSNIITYIDDVLVHSKNHKDHLHHIATALQRLRDAHLRLNVSKCTFGATSVQYLEHTVTSKGVQPGQDKTAAIKDAQPPSTPKQLKSFLGLANYFRSFIPKFSTTAAPLFALTRKDTTWRGGPLPDDAHNAFTNLRAAITSGPLMAFPRRDGKFTLITDAARGDDNSSGGLGAVLFQRQPTGEDRPVGYASRQLLKYEANYPPFLLEMAAAVFGMDYFHHYLVGRRFNLLTDHKPLVPLSITHSKTLNRLQLKMQEMHPDIGYIPGKDNAVSDFLSRYKGMDSTAIHKAACAMTHMDGVGIQSVDLSPDTILGAQRLSPVLQEAAELLRTNNHKRGEKPIYFPRIRQNITWMPNSPCIAMVPRPRKGFVTPRNPLPVIPPSLRPRILREVHNSAVGGHGGTFRTAEQLRRIVWWPSMEAEIQQHIKQCSTCDSTPTTKKQHQGPLQPLPIPGRPHERIHVDLFGPLKTSDTGNKYVLVWTDALTRMTRLTAIKDKTAKTVADALLDIIFATGVPKQIHTDQGLEFCNELLSHIYTALDIEHSTTTPYHPQCNAAAERFNRTMISFLTKAISDADKSTLDWEMYLGPLMLSYNSGINKSTRMSPFYATFGFDPTLPMWQGLEEAPVQNHSYAEALTKLHHIQHTAQRIARENSQAEQKRATNQRNTEDYVTYATLDKVWVHINAKTGPNPKLAKTHEPGMITECLGKNVFKVIRFDRKRKRRATVNVSHLRPRTASHPQDDHFRQLIINELPRHLRPQTNPAIDTETDSEEEPTEHTDTNEQEDTTDQEDNTNTTPGHEDEPSSDTDTDQDDSQDPDFQPPQHAKPRKGKHQQPLRLSRRLNPTVAEDVDIIEAAAIRDIAHLIPERAKSLPFLQAVGFIDHSRLNFNEMLNLVQKGWSLGLTIGRSNATEDQRPQPQRPHQRTQRPRRDSSTSSRQSLALRRLQPFNRTGAAEGASSRSSTRKALSSIKKLGGKAINKAKTIGKTTKKKPETPQPRNFSLDFD